MGTINYMTSKYITLGIEPYNFEDIRNGLIDEITTGNIDFITVDELGDSYVYAEMAELYECDYENAKSIINKYDLEHFTVSIEHGYYEGYSIKISFDYCYFDDYAEKLEAQKEITKIRNILEELNGCGFHAVNPGWVTSYFDYETTQNMIAEAIKDMRIDIKSIPTYKNYNFSWA